MNGRRSSIQRLRHALSTLPRLTLFALGAIAAITFWLVVSLLVLSPIAHRVAS